MAKRTSSSAAKTIDSSANPEEAILAAAKQVFLKKGFAGARMQEIADRAKINKAMLHYYFRSKQVLFDKIFFDALDVMIPTFGKAIGNDGSTLERLERLVDGYMEVLNANPHLPVFLLHEITNNKEGVVAYLDSRTAIQASMQSFFAQVMQDIETGLIAPVNPVQLVLNTVSMTVFPFVTKPIITSISGIDEEVINELLSSRADYIKHTLRTSITTQASPK